MTDVKNEKLKEKCKFVKYKIVQSIKMEQDTDILVQVQY